MKNIFTILLFAVIFALLSTSCDLFHTTDTTRGSSYALIYGVADYIGDNNDLTFTYNDAVDIDDYFTKQNFYTTARFNSDATKAAMLADIETLRTNPDVNENTITVFFFAGHGDGYFRNSPYNDELSDPSFPISETYVGQSSLIPYFTTGSSSEFMYSSELLYEMNTIPGKKLIILDICFAGGFVPDNGVDVDGRPGDYGYNGDPSSFFQTWEKYLTEEKNTTYQDIWVIGSAGENELAYESSGVQNGYYTYYLLKSLGYNHDDTTKSEIVPADSNSDNLITVSEIYHETFKQFEKNYNNNSSTAEYDKYYSHTSGGAKDLILFDLTLED
jgi:hypothetical protein